MSITAKKAIAAKRDERREADDFDLQARIDDAYDISAVLHLAILICDDVADHLQMQHSHTVSSLRRMLILIQPAAGRLIDALEICERELEGGDV